MKKKGSKKNNNQNKKVSQPHDGYIKSVLSNVEVAKSLIRSHLSPELVKRIDIDSVKLTNKSFVTEDLKQMHSDVVYQCNIDNKQGYIYYQIEHQSTPDKRLPLRILDYNIELMKQHMDEGHETLPIIINEVIYAGEKSPYPYTTDIYDLFEDPELAREVMFKPPKMTDLTVKTEEELLQEGIAGLLEVMIKQGIQKDHLKWIQDKSQLVCSIISGPFGHISILYILATDAVNSHKELREAIIKAAPNQKEKVMTALETLKKESIEVGIEKEKFDIAKNMLTKNLDLELITDITGLSEEQIKALKTVLN